MEHVNGWCFRGIYKGGLWENDLHVSARKRLIYFERIAAENKYLERENKPVIDNNTLPVDFMGYSHFAYSHFAYAQFAYSRFAYSQILPHSRFAYSRFLCLLLM